MHAGFIEQTEYDSFDITTLFPPHVQLRGLYISHSASSRTLRKLERGKDKEATRYACVVVVGGGGREYERVSSKCERKEEKSFQELSQSCATLQWLQTPVGRTQVFAEKGNHFTIKTKVF